MNPYEKWKQVGIWINFPQQTFQRCLLVDTTSWRGATSNQHWNNVVYFNVGIYNVDLRWINVVYFKVDINNVRQRRNNVVIFNVDMNNVGKRRNNIGKWQFLKRTKQIIANRIHEIRSFNYYFIIFFILLPILNWICRRVFARPQKFFKYYERFCIART